MNKTKCIAVLLVFCIFSFVNAGKEGKVTGVKIYSPDMEINGETGHSAVGFFLHNGFPGEELFCYEEEVGASCFDKICTLLLYARQNYDNTTVYCAQSSNQGHIIAISLYPW